MNRHPHVLTRTQSSINSSRHGSQKEKRDKPPETPSTADSVTRGIFGDVPLTDSERRFLAAAQEGNLFEIQKVIQENGSHNVNCRDYLGRTALQLAVNGEHYEVIQYVINRSSLSVIEEGLLHAIKSENVRICDIFLNHPIYSDTKARFELEFQHGFYDQEENNSSFAPDITPIVLAAQCNTFDIVHMLIQKGFSIQRPHHYFCLCTECSNHKTFDRFVHSRSRLNAYRGLASTAYLSLSSDDPILAAFELSRQLSNLAETEKEYKNEYKSLSENCKNYAVELLDLCRSTEEVMAALHGGSNTRDLSRIRMAIKYEQKKFIAHASCQEHLMSIWYAGVPWFQHQPFIMKLFLLPLGIMFIPLTAIIYAFIPYSKAGEILRSPFMKFMNYICSYSAFLVLLFVATTQTSFVSHKVFEDVKGILNSLIMFYVLGMFWAECKQLWLEGIPEYFSQLWNYMDITMLALYTASFSIESVVYYKTQSIFEEGMVLDDTANDHGILVSKDSSVPNPQVLSRVLFSVANVLSFARIAYILPASETFGQLQISYGRMLQDVGKFILIYFTVMIAFICGLTSLYSLSHNDNFSNLLTTSGTLFWAAFGMGSSSAPKIEEGGPDSLVEVFGYILYGVYILGAVVVLINMLIAMMSNTFEEIRNDEDVEWKFSRAKLWISFIEEGATLPIPFNIIPTPKSILKLFTFLKHLRPKKLETREESEDGVLFTSCTAIDYKAIMHKVILRYVHKMKFEKKSESLREDIAEVKEEIVVSMTTLCEKIIRRVEKLEHGVRHVQSDLHAYNENSEMLKSKNTSEKKETFDEKEEKPNQPLKSSTSITLPIPEHRYTHSNKIDNERSGQSHPPQHRLQRVRSTPHGNNPYRPKSPVSRHYYPGYSAPSAPHSPAVQHRLVPTQYPIVESSSAPVSRRYDYAEFNGRDTNAPLSGSNLFMDTPHQERSDYTINIHPPMPLSPQIDRRQGQYQPIPEQYEMSEAKLLRSNTMPYQRREHEDRS